MMMGCETSCGVRRAAFPGVGSRSGSGLVGGCGAVRPRLVLVVAARVRLAR